jgi:hypothetical protein
MGEGDERQVREFGGESSAPYRTGWDGGLDKLQRLYPAMTSATA